MFHKDRFQRVYFYLPSVNISVSSNELFSHANIQRKKNEEERKRSEQFTRHWDFWEIFSIVFQ